MNSLLQYELERLARDIAHVHGSVWIGLTAFSAASMGYLYANGHGFFAFLASLMLINTGAALGVWAWLNFMTHGRGTGGR